MILQRRHVKMSSPYFALLLIVHTFICVQGRKIFCYYNSFAQTRQGIGNFLPEDINPHLCTHIVYAFVEITPDGKDLVPFNRNDLGPKGLYARTLALKEKNPSLKVLLAVGGWQIGSKPFIPMVRSESNRQTWIQNVIAYVRKYGFDGFDMDWEFPATRGSPPEDKYRFTLLMKSLYEAFAQEAAETGREKLLLTLATASGTYYIDQSYEPDKIIHYIDYMLLMTYNYHGQWEKQTGHQSGLYPHRDDPKTGEKSQLYQQWSIDYWLDVGIPKSKLVVGLPTYGMTFTLANAADHGVHAPVTGGGRMGDYTREIGILSYYEICLNLRDKGWQSVWIEEQAAPYAYGGDQWGGYDNERSITIKANNIESRDLAGAFVWSVEMDDFRGVCGRSKYPLLTAVHDVIGDKVKSNAAMSLAPVQPASYHEPRTRLYQSPSPIPSVSSQYGGSTRPHKLRWLKSWKRLNGAAAASGHRHHVTLQSQHVHPTYHYRDAIPGVKAHRRVRWWTRKPTWRRPTVTWEPSSRSPTQPINEVAHRPKTHWYKKSGRKQSRNVVLDPEIEVGDDSKMANAFASREVHEVGSWHTARWWSSGIHGWGPNSELNPLIAHATGRPGLGLQLTTKPTTTTSTSTTTTPPPTVWEIDIISSERESSVNAAGATTGQFCHNMGVGTFADPRSCDHFIICMPGNWLNYPPHIMACPAGTRFDANLKICNYASNVECDL